MSSPRTVVVISVTKRNCHTLFLMRLSLQRHFSRLTKFAHVESRLCSHKRPGKAVFYTSINLCVRKHVCRSVVVGLCGTGRRTRVVTCALSPHARWGRYRSRGTHVATRLV